MAAPFVQSGTRQVGVSVVWLDEQNPDGGCQIAVGAEYINLTEDQAQALGRYLLFRDE